MKGKLVKLEWVPGYNMHSSKGCKKATIRKGIQDADYVVYNGHGNYCVQKYSKYLATIMLEDGNVRSLDVRRQLKDIFQIARMNSDCRDVLQAMLPLDVELHGDTLTFLNIDMSDIKIGGEKL